MAKTEIVKVQRPLSSNQPDPGWLIYDRNRKHMEECPEGDVPKHVRDALSKDLKGYFQASWSAAGWDLGVKAPDEDW